MGQALEGKGTISYSSHMYVRQARLLSSSANYCCHKPCTATISAMSCSFECRRCQQGPDIHPALSSTTYQDLSQGCLAAGLVGRRSSQRAKLHSFQESAMKKELDDMEAVVFQLEARAGISALQNPLSGDSHFAVMAIMFSASFTCRYAGSHLVDNRLCMLTTSLTPTSRCRYALTCSCALAGSPPGELLDAQAQNNRVKASSSAQQVSMLASSFFAACIPDNGCKSGVKTLCKRGRFKAREKVMRGDRSAWWQGLPCVVT